MLKLEFHLIIIISNANGYRYHIALSQSSLLPVYVYITSIINPPTRHPSSKTSSGSAASSGPPHRLADFSSPPSPHHKMV
jgi:hypothetical protein